MPPVPNDTKSITISAKWKKTLPGGRFLGVTNKTAMMNLKFLPETSLPASFFDICDVVADFERRTTATIENVLPEWSRLRCYFCYSKKYQGSPVDKTVFPNNYFPAVCLGIPTLNQTTIRLDGWQHWEIAARWGFHQSTPLLVLFLKMNTCWGLVAGSEEICRFW